MRVRAESRNVGRESEQFFEGGSLALLLLLYFLSGTSALIFEMAFTRLYSELFGHTTLAITLVLTAYMGGMSLGAFLGGKLAHRIRRPIQVYGVLEMGVGAWGLTAPYQILLSDHLGMLLGGIFPGTGGALRGGMACILLMVPTAAMGATLPILGRTLSASVGNRAVALLYGSNTLGAVLGVLIAGYGLLRWIGVGGTLYTAAAVGGGAGVSALLLGHFLRNGAEKGTSAASLRSAEYWVWSPTHRKWLSTLFFIGLAALASEVLWTRLLVFTLGANVQTFAMVAACVMLGVSLGSYGASWAVRRWAPEEAWGPWVLTAYGLTLASSVWVVERSPTLGRLSPGSDAGLWREAFVVGSVSLLPSLIGGSVFPLAIHFARSSGGIGRTTGAYYAALTLGNVVGAVVATWILLPAFGSARALLLMGAMAVACAAFLGSGARSQWGFPARLLVPAAAAVTTFAAAAILSTAGMDGLFGCRASHGKLVSVLEVPQGTVTIHDVAALPPLERNAPPRQIGDVGFAYRLIAVDGTTVAGTAADLRTTQRMQAHIPLLLHGKPRRVLQIGYGSGETSGVIELYGVDLDLAEIDPAVPREANRWFPQFAGARFRFILCDAKTYVRTTAEKYDAILNDSTYPGVAGASQLYSEDHFRACRAHLNAGGVFSTWLPIDMPPETLRMVLATFHGVFPNCALWLPTNCLNKHGVLVGSLDDMTQRERELEGRSWPPAVRASLEELGYVSPDAFLSARLLDEAQIARFSAGARKNSDAHPYLEYPLRGGRVSGEDFWGETLAALISVCGDTDSASVYRRADLTLLKGEAKFLGGDPDGALEMYREASLMAPDLPGPSHLAQGIRVNRATRYFLEAIKALDTGNRTVAADSLRKTLGFCKESVAANYEMARLLVDAGDRKGALPYLEASRNAAPPLPDVPLMLADAYLDAGRYAEAEALYSAALASGDRRFELLVALADAKKSQGKLLEAEPLLREALALRPDQKAAQILMAEVETREGRTGEAAKRLEAVLAHSPNSVLALERLADLRFSMGQDVDARALWGRVLELDPSNQDAQAFLGSTSGRRGVPKVRGRPP